MQVARDALPIVLGINTMMGLDNGGSRGSVSTTDKLQVNPNHIAAGLAGVSRPHMLMKKKGIRMYHYAITRDYSPTRTEPGRRGARLCGTGSPQTPEPCGFPQQPRDLGTGYSISGWQQPRDLGTEYAIQEGWRKP
ncbi:hypothetical protein Bbelb_105110 [Branchiostoma belcheri]|nr:hypothetical protein Bbelb_105110 [Branchiostoma belcheri]